MPRKVEKKILTSFFVEKSLKDKLQKKFASMGLGWSSGIRLSLREFDRNAGGSIEDNSEDETAQDDTVQDDTTQDETAQDDTVQDDTTQDETAQDDSNNSQKI